MREDAFSNMFGKSNSNSISESNANKLAFSVCNRTSILKQLHKLSHLFVYFFAFVLQLWFFIAFFGCCTEFRVAKRNFLFLHLSMSDENGCGKSEKKKWKQEMVWVCARMWQREREIKWEMNWDVGGDGGNEGKPKTENMTRV